MNYIVAILEHLIDTYERRGMYNDFDGQKRQGIFLYVEKVFPEYVDTYDGNAYQNINEAIEYLRQQDILQGKKDARGNYGRLQFNLSQTSRASSTRKNTPNYAGGSMPMGCCELRNFGTLSKFAGRSTL